MSRLKSESPARRRILDTASKLFYRDGIRATGIDAVIEQSGVARMTLYNHFPTKEALVEATINEHRIRLAAMIEEIVSDQSLTPSERLLKLFVATTTKTCVDEFRGCPLVNAVVEHPDHASKPFCAAVSAKQLAFDAFETLAKEMRVAEPSLLSEQLMLLVEGSVVRAQMGCGAGLSYAALKAAEALVTRSVSTETIIG